jgi:FKBP-type peptidyl-prolyl cis-trans isomerase
MAQRHVQVFAMILAIVFFVSSFAISFFVIVQLFNDNKEAKTVNQSSDNSSAAQLQGTKLANFTPVETVDKLQISDVQVGNGTEAKAGDTLVVDYTGAVAATGVIFQSSIDMGQPATLSLQSVIKGWQEGIPGM